MASRNHNAAVQIQMVDGKILQRGRTEADVIYVYSRRNDPLNNMRRQSFGT